MWQLWVVSTSIWASVKRLYRKLRPKEHGKNTVIQWFCNTIFQTMRTAIVMCHPDGICSYTMSERISQVKMKSNSFVGPLTRWVFYSIRVAEINMQTSGRVEYMYINVNEEIEIKLTAQHFKKMVGANRCTYDDLHSAVQCEERCFWHQVTEKTKCRGPWMTDLDLPLCNNYKSMRDLIINYRK